MSTCPGKLLLLLLWMLCFPQLAFLLHPIFFSVTIRTNLGT